MAHRIRTHRRVFSRRLSWQEVDAALEVLFAANPDQAGIEGILRRFRRARTQLVPLFVNMLQSPDPQEREMAAFLLREMGGRLTIQTLRKQLADPDLPEESRSSLEAVLHSLGAAPSPEMREQGRRERAARLFDRPPSYILVALEDEDNLPTYVEAFRSLSEERQLALVEQLAAEGDRRALRLFWPLLETESVPLATAVLAGLERLATPDDLPRLEQYRQRAPRKRLKIRVRRIIEHLQATPTPAPPPAVPAAELPLYRAYATNFRGDGEQRLLVVRERSDGRLNWVRVNHDDTRGLLSCELRERQTRSDLRRLLRQWRTEGFVPFEMSVGYCLSALEEAAQLARAQGRELPSIYPEVLSFCRGRRRLERVPLALEPPSYPRRLEETAQLLTRPEFVTWRFSLEGVPGLVRHWHRVEGHRFAANERKGIITQFLQRAVDDALAARLRQRLQGQALLLQRAKEEKAVQLALSAAAGLGPNHQIPLTKHPFLREMVRRSFLETDNPLTAE
ncbi:MAG TPA: hypothetical protein EYP85_00035 [Armatimonadetes bacterium]|nr:hypothetical protein [Armatimonadota bacterium]